MDLTTRQELGRLLGYAVTLLVGGGLSYVLHPLSRGRRLRRAALWFWVWGLAAWVGESIDLAIGGTHRVTRVRETGGWRDHHLDGSDVVLVALFIGACAAVLALWLPFTPRTPPRERRPWIQKRGRRPGR